MTTLDEDVDAAADDVEGKDACLLMMGTDVLVVACRLMWIWMPMLMSKSMLRVVRSFVCALLGDSQPQ